MTEPLNLNFSTEDFANLANINVKLLQLTNQLSTQVRQLADLRLSELITSRQESHHNPFCVYGRKGFSQTDEDGLTFEIIRRLGIENGIFAEFGVGNGTENNTISLLGAKWKGFWVGGEELAFSTEQSNRLFFSRERVNLGNILTLYHQGVQNLGVEDVDLISLDLDGNDFFFVNKILSSGIQPKVFIVEYNAKFPPPCVFLLNMTKIIVGMVQIIMEPRCVLLMIYSRNLIIL
jgi:hypothetical protein